MVDGEQIDWELAFGDMKALLIAFADWAGYHYVEPDEDAKKVSLVGHLEQNDTKYIWDYYKSRLGSN